MWLSSPRPRLIGLLSFAIALQLLLAAPGRMAAAAPLEKSAQSLALAPADSAFYVTMLRNREQIEAIGGSKAWAELQTIPSLQMGWMLLNMQFSDPQSPLGQAKQFFEVPENKQLLKLVGNMMSDEVFFYGSDEHCELLDLFMQINRANQTANVQRAIEGEAENQQARAVVELLAGHTDQIVVPTTVIGFRLESQDAAKAQLARLETIVNSVLTQQAPEYVSRFERRKIGEGEYLTLNLDGSLIPWDEIDESQFDVDPEDYEKLKKHVEGLTLEIHLGLYKNFLLLSSGPDGKHLESLGQGDLLAGRSEFERLAPLSDKRLFGISYLSQRLAGIMSGGQQDIETLRNLVELALPAAELDDDIQSRIQTDVNELFDAAQEKAGEAGAMLGASFGTDRGIESYTFNWSDTQVLDGSQPLTLLKHLGESPLLAIVGRTANDPNDYPALREIVGKVFGYFEEIALPKMSDEDREKFAQAKEKLLPLVKRLDRTTEKSLLPALADGQFGLVIDAKMKSAQWLSALPATAKPLPMLQPALLLGVSDSELLVTAMKQYRKIFNEGIQVVAEISEGKVDGQFVLPAPKVQQVEEGTIYAYPLPADAGVDKRIVPNAGLNDSVAVISASRQHTRKLLAESSLPADGLLAKTDGPLAGFAHFDIAGFADAIHPWIEFGIRVNMAPGGDEDNGAGLGDPANDNENVKQVLTQVQTAINVLKSLRSYTSLTYQEDGVWVSHGELHVVDLE